MIFLLTLGVEEVFKNTLFSFIMKPSSTFSTKFYSNIVADKQKIHVNALICKEGFRGEGGRFSLKGSTS